MLKVFYELKVGSYEPDSMTNYLRRETGLDEPDIRRSLYLTKM